MTLNLRAWSEVGPLSGVVPDRTKKVTSPLRLVRATERPKAGNLNGLETENLEERAREMMSKFNGNDVDLLLKIVVSSTDRAVKYALQHGNYEAACRIYLQGYQGLCALKEPLAGKEYCRKAELCFNGALYY